MARIRRLKTMFGQSAVELAVFGAVVIFVVGLVLRTGLSASHRANIDLRAFRMALQESYLTAMGEYSGQFSSARNNASVLIVEDRLTIDPSKKQGTRDRSPVYAQGSGTMTINLFMSTQGTDIYDLPVFDIIINGQRFPLSISMPVTKDFSTMFDDGDIPLCNAEGYGDFVGTCFDGDPAVQALNNVNDDEFVFFRKAYNGEPGVWCITDSVMACAADPLDPCCLWPRERRFDLNFDGTPDFNFTLDEVPFDIAGSGTKKLIDLFGWQWVRVDESDVKRDMQIDIDGDLREEQILFCNRSPGLVSCKVLDSQEGGYDLSIDEGAEAFYERWRATQSPDPGPIRKPGLQQDVRVYSFTKDGTMLRNEEGKLFDTVNGQFIRNETRQDHLDIIERVIVLSNDTGRFCETPTRPRNWAASLTWARANGVMGMVNPVEACGNCFSIGEDGIDRRKLTCMDALEPTIFVRSRIRDRRKIRWVTRTGDRE